MVQIRLWSAPNTQYRMKACYGERAFSGSCTNLLEQVPSSHPGLILNQLIQVSVKNTSFQTMLKRFEMPVESALQMLLIIIIYYYYLLLLRMKFQAGNLVS